MPIFDKLKKIEVQNSFLSENFGIHFVFQNSENYFFVISFQEIVEFAWKKLTYLRNNSKNNKVCKKMSYMTLPRDASAGRTYKHWVTHTDDPVTDKGEQIDFRLENNWHN